MPTALISANVPTITWDFSTTLATRLFLKLESEASRARPVALDSISSLPLAYNSSCSSEREHGGRTGLEQRVGKAQVLGVVRHGHGHVVVAHARQKQHQVVVEVVAQFLLHIAHGAHLQQAAQRGTGGHRHAGDDIGQVLGVFVDDGAQTDVVVVADFTQANGIGGGLLAAHQLPGLAGVHVGTQAAHRKSSGRETRS